MFRRTSIHPFTGLALLALAGCGPTQPDDQASGPDSAFPEAVTATGTPTVSTGEASTRAALPGLFSIMTELDRDLADLSRGMCRSTTWPSAWMKLRERERSRPSWRSMPSCGRGAWAVIRSSGSGFGGPSADGSGERGGVGSGPIPPRSGPEGTRPLIRDPPSGGWPSWRASRSSRRENGGSERWVLLGAAFVSALIDLAPVLQGGPRAAEYASQSYRRGKGPMRGRA